MINGIKPVVGNTTKTEKTTTKNGLSFDEAMDNLLLQIQVDYDNWGGNRMNRTLNLSLKPGRKFIKVVNDNSVWGFVAKVDGVHKGVPMLKGDILKAASYLTPALNKPRGNIFGNYIVKWTGPVYLNDPAYYRMIGQ